MIPASRASTHTSMHTSPYTPINTSTNTSPLHLYSHRIHISITPHSHPRCESRVIPASRASVLSAMPAEESQHMCDTFDLWMNIYAPPTGEQLDAQTEELSRGVSHDLATMIPPCSRRCPPRSRNTLGSMMRVRMFACGLYAHHPRRNSQRSIPRKFFHGFPTLIPPCSRRCASRSDNICALH